MFLNRRTAIASICLMLLALLVLRFSEQPQAPVEQQQIATSSVANRHQSPAMVLPKTNQSSPILPRAPLAAESFDADLAVALLRQITLNEQGSPVINNQLRRQLDNAVSLIGHERSPAELDKLSQLIKHTFDPARAQTIDHILQRYYSYKMAEQEFATTLNATDSASALKHQQTLSAMRESYLGQELAEQLFAGENSYNKYITELTERLSIPDLSEEMRRNITTELQKKYDQEEEEIGDL